jgi:hypothetical protein
MGLVSVINVSTERLIMFEGFIEVDLSFNTLTHNNGKQCKLYKKDIIIDNDIREIKIYTGVWLIRSWSIPEYQPLLNDYTHLGLALIRANCRLLSFQDLKVPIYLKNILSSYVQEYNYCSFIQVPKNIICNLFDELGIYEEIQSNNSIKEQIKTGGICKRCKSYDEYAEIKSDGTCLCYKCFY